MADIAEIQHAAKLIRDGGLVAFPTETVYGLGADASNAKAVAKIFESKRRPHFDPLIVHVSDASAAWRYAVEVPDLAFKLAERFWPGPLTIVLKKSDAIPSLVTSGLDTVGLRVPNHPIAQQLLQLADRPIAAPSANHFGSTSPTRANHVKVDCDLLLDGGPCTTGIESTVIAIGNDNQITLLRPGGTTAEAIESLTGQPLRQRDPSNRQATKAPASPGMIDRHYATDTPLQLLDADEPIPVPPDSASWGLMTFNAAGVNERYKQIKHLGPDGDLTAAAAQLFEAMHNLDRCGLDRIIAQPAPMLGLGIAINDRLRRASQKAEPDPTS